jgi:hypothetical protein
MPPRHATPDTWAMNTRSVLKALKGKEDMSNDMPRSHAYFGFHFYKT